MKVLILGSNGYIGRHLAFYLHQLGVEIVCSDIAPAFKDVYKGYTYLGLDLSSYEQCTQLPTDADFIFIFSGLTGTGAAFNNPDPFVKSNETLLLNLLRWHKEMGLKAKLIFPSTRLVYKGVKNLPLKEDAEKEFKTVYAMNKFACEQYLAMWHNAFGTPYTIFRICVPYGNLLDNAYSYGTLGFFLNKAAAGEAISLYGDGSLRRTFTFVGDLCKLMWEGALADAGAGEIYNIPGDNASLLEVAAPIAEKFGVEVAFVPFPALDAQIESGDTIFDGSKLMQKTGLTLSFSVLDWIADIKR